MNEFCLIRAANLLKFELRSSLDVFDALVLLELLKFRPAFPTRSCRASAESSGFDEAFMVDINPFVFANEVAMALLE